VVRQGGDNPLKDTHRNIVETGEFVVNIISDWFVNAANHTSIPALHGENEMDIAGLSPVESSKVKPPRVGESAMQFECKLKTSVDITNAKGEVTATMFLGEVIMFHVHEELLDLSFGNDKPQIKLEGYRPVSRLGGNTYGLTTEAFDIGRPVRPKEGFAKK
jgi:flavin reductase (DIM6/NTAB) family NADH-FMN oxidoreductase RutF